MAEDDRDPRLARIERRIAGLEANMLVFQATVASKLTEAITLLRRRQETREAKVADALKKLSGELTEIRDRLGSVTGSSRLTH